MPDSSVYRKINFVWQNIPETTNILLFFTPPSDVVPGTASYSIWRQVVVNQNHGSAYAEYFGKYAVGASTIGTGNRVNTNIWTPMKIGSTVNLKDIGNNTVQFDEPVDVPGSKLVVATNNSGRPQTMSVGTYVARPDGLQIYTPVFAWKNVGNTLKVTADFHPILQAVISTDLKQNEFITADISSSIIWSKNLVRDLVEETTFRLIKNGDGSYELTQLIDNMMLFRAPTDSTLVKYAYSLRLNWPATVGVGIVGAVFAYSTAKLTGLGYNVIVKEKVGQRYREMHVTRGGQSCADTEKVVRDVVTEAIKNQTPKNFAYVADPHADDGSVVVYDATLAALYSLPNGWYFSDTQCAASSALATESSKDIKVIGRKSRAYRFHMDMDELTELLAAEAKVSDEVQDTNGSTITSDVTPIQKVAS